MNHDQIMNTNDRYSISSTFVRSYAPLALAGALAVAACSSSEGAATKADSAAAASAGAAPIALSPQDVAVAKVADVTTGVLLTGTLEPAERVTVTAQVGGTLEQLLVDRGTVARKDPAADPSTRQVGVYVRLPNAKGEITAGQYARGRVSGRRVEGAVVVPSTAVRATESESAVFVIEGNQLARRVVTLGARDEGAGTVAVTSGLRPGERVLARPTASIAAGQPVVVEGEGAGTTQSSAGTIGGAGEK